MNSRLFLYSAFFFVTILLYDAYSYKGQTLTPPADIGEESYKSPPSTDTTKDISKIQPKSGEVNTRISQVSVDKTIDVESDNLKVKISLYDGSIVRAELKKFRESFGGDSNVVLIDASESGYKASSDVQLTNIESPREYSSDSQAFVADTYPYSVIIRSDKKNYSVIKKYTFYESSHLINVENEVYNKSTNPIQARYYNTIQRGEDLSSNVMLYTYTGAAFYDDENKFSKVSFDDIADTNLQLKTKSSWISMLEHYFFSAWISTKDSAQTIYTRNLSSSKIGSSYLVGSVSDYFIIPENSSKVFSSELYVGPKTVSEISTISNGLDLTVDYGVLTFLAAPLFWVLDKLNLFLNNWGLALIMLTILIKILFFKLSETSYKSMAKMKKLAPRMTALKERYSDNRQKFSEELMKVYKQEKVNPLGGCLPILVQIPVFIALYWVIIESVEMRHAPFIGWIGDLSSKDPFYVLPILMGVSMYIQQKLNPPPTDAMQQKIFLALPFIFTALFATFPSGLVLYWLVNNVLSIAQQYLINKRLSV